MKRYYPHSKAKVPELTEELRKDAAKAKLKELRRLSTSNKNVKEWFYAVRSTGQALSFLTESEFESLVLYFQNEAREHKANLKEKAMLKAAAERDFQELFRRKAQEFAILTDQYDWEATPPKSGNIFESDNRPRPRKAGPVKTILGVPIVSDEPPAAKHGPNSIFG